MSSKSEVSSLETLEQELINLVQEDNDYWLRNDAKFRAIEQTSNYDDFDRFVKEIIINY